MLCYYDTPCNAAEQITNIPPSPPLTYTNDDPRLSFFCGTTWEDASSSCSVWCPDADDSKCPPGM